jgi:hypothetical protein
VVVMGSRPGRVLEIVDVYLAHPAGRRSCASPRGRPASTQVRGLLDL